MVLAIQLLAAFVAVLIVPTMVGEELEKGTFGALRLAATGSEILLAKALLMPVLVGQLDSEHRTRHTWEQSVDAWRAELARAGFHPSSRRIFDHWWAPAHLIVGHRD